MSFTGAIGLILSLLMTISSIAAPGAYQEVTVSDPILTVPSVNMVTEQDEEGSTSYSWETVDATYDLTGISLTVGLGTSEDASGGAVLAAAKAGNAAINALASVAGGKASLYVDGMSKLITCDVPTEDQLEQIIVELSEGQLPEGSVDFDKIRSAVQSAGAGLSPEAAMEMAGKISARVEEYFGDVEFESLATAEVTETFLDGAFTETVTRTDFTLTGEQTAALVARAMDFVKAVLTDMYPMLADSIEVTMDEDTLASVGATQGTLYSGENLSGLDLTLSSNPGEDGEAHTVRLYGLLRQAGGDFRGCLTVSQDGQDPELTVDVTGNAAFESETEGEMTMEASVNGRQVMTLTSVAHGGTVTQDMVLTIPSAQMSAEVEAIAGEVELDDEYEAVPDLVVVTQHTVSTHTEDSLTVESANVFAVTTGETTQNTYADMSLSAQCGTAAKLDAALTVRQDNLPGDGEAGEVANMAFSYDGAVSEENGVKTVSGPLSFSVDAMGTSIAFSCNIAAKTASLTDYVSAEMPAGMETVDVTALTEEDITELKNALMGFAMSAMTIPGVQAIMGN